jgi:hypothetical protein
MKKHTKVFWTTQEREQIYARLKGLFLTDRNISDTDALEMAQRILPSHRRRPNKYKLAWIMRSVINQARLEAEMKDNGKPEGQTATESSVLFDVMVEAVAEKIAARVKELLK